MSSKLGKYDTMDLSKVPRLGKENNNNIDDAAMSNSEKSDSTISTATPEPSTTPQQPQQPQVLTNGVKVRQLNLYGNRQRKSTFPTRNPEPTNTTTATTTTTAETDNNTTTTTSISQDESADSNTIKDTTITDIDASNDVTTPVAIVVDDVVGGGENSTNNNHDNNNDAFIPSSSPLILPSTNTTQSLSSSSSLTSQNTHINDDDTINNNNNNNNNNNFNNNIDSPNPNITNSSFDLTTGSNNTITSRSTDTVVSAPFPKEQFDEIYRQTDHSINLCKTTTSDTLDRLEAFEHTLRQRQRETVSMHKQVSELLLDANNHLEKTSQLINKGHLPDTFRQFLSNSTNALRQIIDENLKLINKSQNFIDNNHNTRNNNQQSPSKQVKSEGWDNQNDEIIVTPTKSLSGGNNNNNNNNIAKDAVNSSDVSFDLDGLGSHGFSPNRNRQSPSTTQLQQQLQQQLPSPLHPVRQITNKFRTKGQNTTDASPTTTQTSPSVSATSPTTLTVSTDSFKLTNDDFDDDESACFKPKAKPTPPSQLEIISPVNEVNNRPPTPFRQSQPSVSNPHAWTEDDFDDDESACFKPKAKPVVAVATTTPSQQDLAVAFKDDDDFDDDESACFKPKTVQPLLSPPPQSAQTYDDDFEDDDCVVTHPVANHISQLNNFSTYFTNRPDIDTILAQSTHVDTPYETYEQYVELSDEGYDYEEDDDNEDDDDNGENKKTKKSALLPGTSALNFINNFAHDGDESDEDDNDGTKSSNQCISQEKPTRKRVRFSSKTSTNPVLSLRVLPFSTQSYESLEYIRDYNEQKDGHVEPIVIEGDTYNDDLDIDSEHNIDSTLFHQLETRENTEANTTPGLSPRDANNAWGLPPNHSFGFTFQDGAFDYVGSNSSDDDDYYGQGGYDGGYFTAAIPPPPPNDDEFDSEAHTQQLMNLLFSDSSSNPSNNNSFGGGHIDDDEANIHVLDQPIELNSLQSSSANTDQI